MATPPKIDDGAQPAEPTYTTATAVAVVRDVDPTFDAVRLRQWRAKGWSPVAGDLGSEVVDYRARYTRDDLVRLRVMVELARHHGLPLEHAHHVARARGVELPKGGDARHFLVFIDGEPDYLAAREIPGYFAMPNLHTGRPLFTTCSAVVVDVAKAAASVDAMLRAGA